MQPPKAIATWDTGLEPALLKYIGAKSVHFPEKFVSTIFTTERECGIDIYYVLCPFQVVHPHLQKTHIQNRLNKLIEGQGLDWATAEALAIGSLLYQGKTTTSLG